MAIYSPTYSCYLGSYRRRCSLSAKGGGHFQDIHVPSYTALAQDNQPVY